MNEHKGIVLALCNKTPNAVIRWRDAGYECWCIDIQHEGDRVVDGIRYIQADVTRWIPPVTKYAFVAAFPPCTHLAVSGARWFKGKGLYSLADSVRIVAACSGICEATGCPYFIENPVSTLATYWRKPDHTFDPCDFAGYLEDPSLEAYTKKTCLWTGGGFVMPEKRRVEPTLGSKMHLLPPSDERGDLRSVTPLGFSIAVFEANSSMLEVAL